MASIGPRLFSRGKRRSRLLHKSHSGSLQLGRGFSAAESIDRNNMFTIQWKLQLGRGFSAAERPTCIVEVVVPGVASIGPRLFSRGKWSMVPSWSGRSQLQLGRGFSAAERPNTYPYHPHHPRFNWAAAFQPRKGPVSWMHELVDGVLQLGRGFSAAESQTSL